MNDIIQGSFLDRTLKGAWRAVAGVARGMTNGASCSVVTSND